jgi:hypothetical protein
MAKATAVTYLMPPGAQNIKKIAIGDGDKSKWGVYDVTSVDLTTLVLTRAIDLSAADAVVKPDNGDLGAGGGSLHYNAGLTYTRKIPGSTDKLSGADANAPKRIATSMIYLEDQPGTLSADGKTLTLDNPLPSYDGFAPANNYYVVLARQNGNQFDIENGHWVQVSSTVLTRLSWLDDHMEIKHNQEYIVNAGHRWRNSVWRLVSGGSFNVNPASVPVAFECISAPNDDRRSCCILDFLEGTGSAVENRSLFGGAGGIGMGGTLTGASPGTWWSTDGPTGKSITIPGTEYVEIGDGKNFMMDTYDHRIRMFFKTAATGGVRLFDRSDGDGSWETSERYLYVTGTGEIGMEFWGIASLLWAGESFNDDKWHHLDLRAFLTPNTSDVTYGLIVDNRFLGGKKVSSLSGSNQNHLLRIGHTGSSEALSVAGFRLENLGRR